MSDAKGVQRKPVDPQSLEELEAAGLEVTRLIETMGLYDFFQVSVLAEAMAHAIYAQAGNGDERALCEKVMHQSLAAAIERKWNAMDPAFRGMSARLRRQGL